MSSLIQKRSAFATLHPQAVLQVLLNWDQRRRSRAALARLEPRGLRDIGINTDEAAREAARPFWIA